MRTLKLFAAIFALGILSACVRGAIPGPELALRPVSRVPSLEDDLGLPDFKKALQKNIAFLEKSDGLRLLRFGKEVFAKPDYLDFLKSLAAAISKAKSEEEALKSVSQMAQFYEVYGSKKWGQVFVTGYFEPVIHGSAHRTERYSQALYRAPSDLLRVNLAKFSEKFSSERAYRGRTHKNEILPYYSRTEIDRNDALKGKNLEICWVDPIDAFFLHIQGSGTVRLTNGKEIVLNYAEKNGAEYQPIGKFLKDKINSPITMQGIEAYLRTLSPSERNRYLDMNPSYVFFRTSKEHAKAQIGIEAVPGRSIAVDRKYFPKGALGFLAFPKPLTNEQGGAVGTVESGRFVFDHDTGGAITGPGRVDLFVGRGDEAKASAGALSGVGTLYYLGPKLKS